MGVMSKQPQIPKEPENGVQLPHSACLLIATSSRAPNCPLVNDQLEVPGSVVTRPTLTFPKILPNQAPVDASTASPYPTPFTQPRRKWLF